MYVRESVCVCLNESYLLSKNMTSSADTKVVAISRESKYTLRERERER